MGSIIKTQQGAEKTSDYEQDNEKIKIINLPLSFSFDNNFSYFEPTVHSTTSGCIKASSVPNHIKPLPYAREPILSALFFIIFEKNLSYF